MFFLTPYYHTAFPNIKLMIVMDLDLEFRSVCHRIAKYKVQTATECRATLARVDPKEAWAEYETFHPLATMGVARDLDTR